MKKTACVLLSMVFVLPAFLSAASAEPASGRTDLISDMQKPFNTREEAKDAERVKQLQDVTGQEWIELSLGERMDHMLAALYVLNGSGVTPRRSINDYCNAVERSLVLHSDWSNRQLTDILADVLYDKEPASRPALDKFKAGRTA